ncbi:hypothetical protein EYF80_018781 [Liparis tanakae]|uniref:Uncharacterized protein n=1 Tax=Liparis tanakae TaxID=230148 RepID=A0A4Z2I049_9TELE|nr:hypothetical protein EYF80_018781 [Liparis tanakae]
MSVPDLVTPHQYLPASDRRRSEIVAVKTPSLCAACRRDRSLRVYLTGVRSRLPRSGVQPLEVRVARSAAEPGFAEADRAGQKELAPSRPHAAPLGHVDAAAPAPPPGSAPSKHPALLAEQSAQSHRDGGVVVGTGRYASEDAAASYRDKRGLTEARECGREEAGEERVSARGDGEARRRNGGTGNVVFSHLHLMVQVWVQVCSGPLAGHQLVLECRDPPADVRLRDGLHEESALCQAEAVHCPPSLVLLGQQHPQIPVMLQVQMRALDMERQEDTRELRPPDVPRRLHANIRVSYTLTWE